MRQGASAPIAVMSWYTAAGADALLRCVRTERISENLTGRDCGSDGSGPDRTHKVCRTVVYEICADCRICRDRGTIEETVAREVMEEVGLKVKNIRYYKSQPWSFSDTLLMGFFAELDGDDRIRLDENELSVAKWCTREEVPQMTEVSLTREMMRVF